MANLQWSNASGAIDKDSHVDLLDKSIDVMFNRENKVPLALAKYFDVRTKENGLTDVIGDVGSTLGLPRENEDLEDIPQLVPAPGYTKTIVLQGYRSGIRVTDTQMQADRFGVITTMISGQMKSAMRKDEYQRSGIFDDGFSGTSGSDSLSLYNDSHPHENPEKGTWDNRGTGALTGANLQSLRLIMRQLTDDQGDPMDVFAQDLIIPEDLEQKALELTGSFKRAEDALNAETQLIRGLNVVVSTYFSSAVQYHLAGDLTGHARGLFESVLTPWNIKNDTKPNVDVVISKRIKSVKAFAFTRSKNLCGSTGS